MVWSVGTSAVGAILLFHAMGIAAYLQVLSEVLGPGPTAGSFAGNGLLVLVVLAVWSWGSALAMSLHRGGSKKGGESCILAPSSTGYDAELGSVWEMRLPHVVSSSTGPTGTAVLDYHAILVSPNSEGDVVYNWSKTRMRFEALDAARNPYLPTVCP